MNKEWNARTFIIEYRLEHPFKRLSDPLLTSRTRRVYFYETGIVSFKNGVRLLGINATIQV